MPPSLPLKTMTKENPKSRYLLSLPELSPPNSRTTTIISTRNPNDHRTTCHHHSRSSPSPVQSYSRRPYTYRFDFIFFLDLDYYIYVLIFFKNGYDVDFLPDFLLESVLRLDFIYLNFGFLQSIQWKRRPSHHNTSLSTTRPVTPNPLTTFIARYPRVMDSAEFVETNFYRDFFGMFSTTTNTISHPLFFYVTSSKT